MKKFISTNWLPATLAVIVLMVTITGGEQISRWWVRFKPPIDWQSVEVLTPEVRPGDELRLVYTRTVNRTCPADLRGFLIAKDGSAPVRFPIVAGGYAKPTDGPETVLVKIAIPKTSDPGLGALLPGPYVYRTLATRYCPEGVEEDNDIPEAYFTIK